MATTNYRTPEQQLQDALAEIDRLKATIAQQDDQIARLQGSRRPNPAVDMTDEEVLAWPHVERGKAGIE